jgi:release factor glutamine methyltransferase
MTEPYEPREDSLLLRRIVENISAEAALEIGCGVGFVLEALAERCRWVVGVDINVNALLKAKCRLRGKGFANFELVCCSSAEAFTAGSFDLIVFNPPYLPSERIEDVAVDGGEGGVAVTLSWLKECRRVIKPSGKVIIISSSLASQDLLIEGVSRLGYKIKLIATQPLFFEELYAYELSLG